MRLKNALGAGSYGADKSTRTDMVLNSSRLANKAVNQRIEADLAEHGSRFDLAMILYDKLFKKDTREELSAEAEQLRKKAKGTMSKSNTLMEEAQAGASPLAQKGLQIFRGGLDIVPQFAADLAMPVVGGRVVGAIRAGIQSEIAGDNEGLDIGKQAAKGIVSGAVEYAAEGMGGMFKGKAATRIGGKVAERAAKSAAGDAVLKALETTGGQIAKGGIEEASEELVGGVFTPIIEELLNIENRGWGNILTKDDWAQIWEEALVAGALGAGFGGGTVILSKASAQNIAQTAVIEHIERQSDQSTQLNSAQSQHTQWLKSIGAQSTELNTLEKYNEGKYNNTEEYQLLMGYDRAVDRGHISSLVGFELYKKTNDEINRIIVGQTTSTGIPIESFTTHFIDRVIGQTSTSHSGMRQGVEIESVLDALVNPLKVSPKRHLSDGDIRQTFYGENATCVISVRDHRLIQANRE